MFDRPVCNDVLRSNCLSPAEYRSCSFDTGVLKNGEPCVQLEISGKMMRMTTDKLELNNRRAIQYEARHWSEKSTRNRSYLPCDTLQTAEKVVAQLRFAMHFFTEGSQRIATAELHELLVYCN
eukprot:TRINITY_DN12037_c0_g2_i3.p2 TRINITY_DN12037_c0_g2~~TRINITY_DN12037_c0_g2_i3.p2  ORF type:complete len:123 (+),score=7.19 TRINITY_DN12037_c0_g2_i3:2541-2909(+)